MTPLRAKMIRELQLHRKSPKTIGPYVAAVAPLAKHYGLLANCVKRQRLGHCRRLLGAHAPPPADEQPRTAVEWLLVLLDIDVSRCPQCGGRLDSASLPRPGSSPPQAWQTPDDDDFPPWDTS